MSHSLPESWRTVVADTSAIINLNSTGCAEEIYRLFPVAPVVPEAVRAELRRGGARAQTDRRRLEALCRAGACSIAAVGEGAAIERSLLEGRAVDTLDDGEAATIAYAAAYGRAALLDDRKARRICAERFPETALIYTVELLLHRAVRVALGERGQADAIVAALQGARMRVPFERVPEVVALIGEDRAASCPSLPGSARPSASG